MKWLFSPIFLMMLSCSSIVPLSKIFYFPVLSAPFLDKKKQMIADYHLKFLQGTETKILLIHLEVSTKKISFHGFGMLGEIVFECYYKKMSQICNGATNTIPANKLFEDFQLVFWPIEELNSQIKSSDFSISEEVGHRRLFYQDELITEIIYNKKGRSGSNVTVDNKKYKYQLQITPLKLNKTR